MKSIHLLLLVGVLLISLTPDANAESDCDSVLEKDLQVNRSQSSDRLQAAQHFACSHTFQEFNNTYGAGASFTYALIGGSGQYNQDNYSKFVSDSCSRDSSFEHQSGFQYYSLRDASAGVVAAWQACMLGRDGLNCWAEPESGDIAVVLSLKEPGRYSIKDTTLSGGVSLQSSAAVITTEATLQYGQTRIVVKRASPTTSVGFTLNLHGADKS